jgi:hypothetical protein
MSNSSTTSSSQTVDTLIIGGGLTGLFLAHQLHQQLAERGHQIALLEAREHVGGRYRRANPAQPYSSPALDFIPAIPEAVALLEWLRNVSPVPLHFTATEHHPQIFDEGKWRPFAGFGDSGFQSVAELSSLFNHVQGLELTPGLEQLARALSEQLPIAAHTMSEVTGFKVSDGRISEITVNGDKVWRAQNVIFTGHPASLGALFQGEELPVKHRTRLAKMQSWTAVTLELQHTPPLLEDGAVRLFSHSAKEFEPVVGRVFGPVSKWMTLLPGERETDHEFVGQCIRHIKRQLKRAWPLAFASAEGQKDMAAERIYVQPNAYGQHTLKTKENFRFPEISNLYLASHALSPIPGELAAVDVVHQLAAELLGPLNQLPELGASC